MAHYHFCLALQPLQVRSFDAGATGVALSLLPSGGTNFLGPNQVLILEAPNTATFAEGPERWPLPSSQFGDIQVHASNSKICVVGSRHMS